jgi:hypothetical protein
MLKTLQIYKESLLAFYARAKKPFTLIEPWKDTETLGFVIFLLALLLSFSIGYSTGFGDGVTSHKRPAVAVGATPALDNLLKEAGQQP